MDAHIERVRRFNRFYTRYAGVLQKDFLGSSFSLVETRVLYEIAHRDGPTATELAKTLSLDNGYLSRILQEFARRGFVRRKRSETDGRQSHLYLTARGRDALAPVERRQHEKIATTLSSLADEQHDQLTSAMATIERLLGEEPPDDAAYALRTVLQPGDIGWVVQRQGVMYAREYGWDETFEALVAQITAAFVEGFDPRRDRIWIAERRGERVGSIFLIKKTETESQLRLLFVEPSARGLGIGRRLVRECADFARQAGYRKMTLWTNSILDAARHLYEEAGFRLVKEEPHQSFGHDLTGQFWELPLA